MKKITIIITMMLSINMIAQERKINEANSDYSNYAYIDAISIYEKVADKGYKSKDLFQKLGDAYYFNGILDKSNDWYEKLFDLNETVDPEYYFRYAQSLKGVKSYKKADKMMEKFYELTNDYRGELYIENKNYLLGKNDSDDLYTINDAGVNSEESDYGSYFLGNKMYFVSSRKFEKSKNIIDKWTNQNYSNLLSARFDEKGNPVYIDELTDELNSKYHESSLVFSKDGNTMYFTRNNFNKGKIGMNQEQIVLLKIYKATLVDGKWKEIIELPFNSNEYSVAHPALSADEKTLFFASDMPGGFGSSDLYKVSINDDGTFGEPINLGYKVNTKSRETFPFVSKHNELIFASDGHLGLGGLDLFKATKDDYGHYTNFENLGKPINSERDDFAYSESPFEKTYYITSNRDGGKGFDDIYKVIENPKPKTRIIEDIVVDNITRDTIQGAIVKLFDANQNLIEETITDDNGKFTLNNAREDRDYFINIESKDHFIKEIRLKASEKANSSLFEVDPKYIKIKPGLDLVKAFNISIYFDLDKHFIRPDAETELAKIIEVMKQNPSIKVDIRSHTDSRQSESYNLRLSDFRAKSTMKYMINKGISKSRLTAKGYGESELLNGCSNGVNCTEAEHQLNRRSEFIIQ